MNKTIEKFIEKLDVDLDKFNSLKSNQVESDIDINWVIAKFRKFKSNREMKLISIEDVVGFDYKFRGLDKGSVIDTMSYFFDEDGDGYQSRSISMLEYDSNEVMQQLDGSFTHQPIYLTEVDNAIYNISTN